MAAHGNSPFRSSKASFSSDLVMSQDTSLSSAVDIRWTMSVRNLVFTQQNYDQGLSTYNNTTWKHSNITWQKKYLEPSGMAQYYYILRNDKWYKGG